MQKTKTSPFSEIETLQLKEELANAYKRLSGLQDELRELEAAQKQATLKALDADKCIADRGKMLIHQQSEIDDIQKRLNEATVELETLRIEHAKLKQLSDELILECDHLVSQIVSKSNQNVELANKNLDIQECLDRAMIELNTKVKELKLIKETQGISSDNEHTDGTLASNAAAWDHPSPIPTEIQNVIRNQSELTCASYNQLGNIFLTTGLQRDVRIWDATTGVSRGCLTGATQTSMSACFSLDDQYVLACNNDNATRVWHNTSQRLRHTLTGHTSKVFSGVFSDNANKAVTGSYDRTIKIWDLARGYSLRSLFCFSFCNSLCLNQDNTAIYSGHFDGHVRAWDIKSGRMIVELDQIHSAQITYICLAPEALGVMLFLTNSRDNTLSLIDMRMNRIVHRYTCDHYKTSTNWNKVCMSPDGEYIAAGSYDGSIIIWESKTEKVLKVLKGHSDAVTCVAWNPNNSGTIVSSDKSGMIIMWK